MNKLTTVLTLTSLTAALASTFFATPGLADTSSLDKDVVTQAQASGQKLTSDELDLFNAINAVRTSAPYNLPAFQLDPALIEPARYEVMDQVKVVAGGNIAFLADGTTQVPLQTLAADFGADTTGFARSVFDNYSFTNITPVLDFFTARKGADGNLLVNWDGAPNFLEQQNLMQVWQEYTNDITPILADPAVTRIGVGTVRVLYVPTYFGSVPIIKWNLFGGTGPVPGGTGNGGGTGSGGGTSSGSGTGNGGTGSGGGTSSGGGTGNGGTGSGGGTGNGSGGTSAVPPPTLAAPATASPSTVTGTTVSLSALGAYAGGESGLTYTWAVTSGSPVLFSANGTNDAKNTTATFTQPGAYAFQVSISDAKGETVTSSVNVTVSQALTTMTITPGSVGLKAGATQQFTVAGTDQFGGAVAVSPTWTVSNGGTISSTGLFTVDITASGTYTVTATSGSVSATSSGTITAAPPSLYSFLTTKYDKQIVDEALASGPTLTPDELDLFNAINAVRTSAPYNLPAFQLDPALIEPARYEVMDQVKVVAGGNIAFLADGTTQVPLQTLAADFGADTTGFARSVFDNYSFTNITPVLDFFTARKGADGNLLVNWDGAPNFLEQQNLMQVWQEYTNDITPILADPAVTRIGVGTVRVLYVPTYFGSVPIIKWNLFGGQ